jgi:hypothetical protein
MRCKIVIYFFRRLGEKGGMRKTLAAGGMFCYAKRVQKTANKQQQTAAA